METLKEDVDGAPPPAPPKRGPGRPPGSGKKGAAKTGPKVKPLDNATWDRAQTAEAVAPSDGELQIASAVVLTYEIAMSALAGPRGAAAVHDHRGQLGTAVVRLARAFPVDLDPRWVAVGGLFTVTGAILASSGTFDPITAAVARAMQNLAGKVDRAAQDAADKVAGAPPTVDVAAQ